MTSEQIEMIVRRYALAAACGRGRRALEVGCGPGLGLGALAREAQRVAGGDIVLESLLIARREYGNRVWLVGMDAHALPFQSGAFDVVLLFEVIYYLGSPDLVLEECRRILSPGGEVLICLPNPDIPGFNSSPCGRGYMSAPALRQLLQGNGFATTLYGGFPIKGSAAARRAIATARRTAASVLGCLPGGESLKRLARRTLLGQKVPLPGRVEVAPTEHPLVPIPGDRIDRCHRVLYAVGRTESSRA